MALVVTNGSKWGALTTTGTTGGAEAPLPMCLARLVQNKNQVLVDALPYLDKDYDQPAIRDLVDSMIDEEMDRFEPEDYISSLQPVPPPSFKEGSMLAQEYERVVSDPSSSLSAVDISRYQPRLPSGKDAGNSAAWEEAVKRAQIGQEHGVARLVNQELLSQYGVNSWRALNAGLEDQISLYKQELEREKIRVLDINRKRMAAQITIENKLQKLEDKYKQQVAKNMRIEAECIFLEKSLPQ